MSASKTGLADALKSCPKQAGKREAKGRSRPKSIGARVTVEERAELTRLCTELGIDDSTLVRRALEQYVESLPGRSERAVNLAETGDYAPIGIELCPWLRAFRNTVNAVNHHAPLLDTMKVTELDADKVLIDLSHTNLSLTESHCLGKKRGEKN